MGGPGRLGHLLLPLAQPRDVRVAFVTADTTRGCGV